MYKIGEVSKITHLTIKALRYYHEQGILIPEQIDKFTGYRQYSLKQIEVGKTIKLLRNLEFNVKEIKDIIKYCDDVNDLPYYMKEKIFSIDFEIKRLNKVKRNMQISIEQRKESHNMNEYEVFIKTIDEVAIISTRYKGKYSDVGQYISKLFKAAKGASEDVPFNLYHDECYRENADIEVCLPVKKEIQSKGITYRVLPKIKALWVIHVGDYSTIGNAYQAITDYAKRNNLTTATPHREIYRKGPGMLFRGNPNKYVTVLIMPIV